MALNTSQRTNKTVAVTVFIEKRTAVGTQWRNESIHQSNTTLSFLWL
jgi:hypothetical protein